MDNIDPQAVDNIASQEDRSWFHLSSALKSKLIFLLMILFLIIGILVALNNIYHAPPAKITIDPKGLSAAQYHQLNETMQAQQVGSFFTTDLSILQNAALRMPWIEDVSIQRDWNRGIVISALARQPVAKFGSERLIDATGHAYIPADSQSLYQPDFANLQGDSSQSVAIMQMTQQVNEWYAPVGIQIQDVFLSPRMTWLFRFNNGMRIIVDNENTYQKLFTVSQLLDNQLANRQDQIQSVDLRYKNGFAITWKSDNVDPLTMIDASVISSGDNTE